MGIGAFIGRAASACQPLPRSAPPAARVGARSATVQIGRPPSLWTHERTHNAAPLAGGPPGRRRPTCEGARQRQRQTLRQGPEDGTHQTPGAQRPKEGQPSSDLGLPAAASAHNHVPLYGARAHRPTNPDTGVIACTHGGGYHHPHGICVKTGRGAQILQTTTAKTGRSRSGKQHEPLAPHPGHAPARRHKEFCRGRTLRGQVSVQAARIAPPPQSPPRSEDIDDLVAGQPETTPNSNSASRMRRKGSIGSRPRCNGHGSSAIT